MDDDQGELSRGTVQLCTHLNLVLLNLDTIKFRSKFSRGMLIHVDLLNLNLVNISTVSLIINEGSFSKASAPPLFLEDENIFQKSVSMVVS